MTAYSPLVHELLGEVEAVEQTPGLHPTSQCLRVVVNPRETVFLKFHKTARSFRQEHAFYRELGHRLTGVPSLLAAWSEHRALLLDSLPGCMVSSWKDIPRGTYLAAGGFLRRLHDLPIADTDMPILQAVEKRLEAFEARNRGLLSSLELKSVTTPIRELIDAAPPLKRVYCHRDFAEHNWLHDGEKISVVDFEHSKADFWLFDLCRLHALTLSANEAASQEFWSGYGRSLDRWHREFLERWSILWAYETKFWGSRHGDPACVAWGETALANLT